MGQTDHARLCVRCDKPMTVVEVGQLDHPWCDPAVAHLLPRARIVWHAPEVKALVDQAIDDALEG